MEISQVKSGTLLIVTLAGRLDAGWCEPVENALVTAIRSGEHRIHLDMAKVNYISSAGIRVLLSGYKQLSTIHGTFGVIEPSPNVRSVLELSGLKMLIAERELSVAPDLIDNPPAGEISVSEHARYEVFSRSAAPMRLTPIGREDWLREPGAAAKIRLGENEWAFGIGALGRTESVETTCYGELLAVAGIAAVQPTDGSSRPDFIVREGELIPEGELLAGFFGTGEFSLLARFEAMKEPAAIPLSELARRALELSGSDLAVVVGIADTAGLVGASLQQPPSARTTTDPLAFPEIRDWVSFTSERAFRDSTSLWVGVVARESAPLLRSWGEGLFAHFHAASFPYRPLQKGVIDLAASVRSLFDIHHLQAVTHLLADPREFSGVGESEFLRGALWIAPVTS